MAMYGVKKSLFTKNVSSILIGINVFIFLLQKIFGDAFNLAFSLQGTLLLSEPWRLITSMFMHANFTHLLFNMYALLIFGPLIEQKIGSKRFLYVYFIAGLVGSFAFAFFSPSTFALGASGAIMGILGLVIILLPKLKVLFFFVIPMSMRTAGILFALFDIVGFAFGGTGIGHAAHLGGLAIGLLYGFYLLWKRKSFTERFTQGPSVKQKQTSSRNPGPAYEQTIELTKDEMDDYFKYGKI